MSERPILFSGEMVRAILRDENPKTVTRRLIPSPVESELGLRGWRDRWGNLNAPGRHPYGDPGDRLWVRETFTLESCFEFWYEPPFFDGRPLKAEGLPDGHNWWVQPHYRATDPEPELCAPGKSDPGCVWRPSIFMPRWASRITLEVVSVRAERLQEITEEDARAEGVQPFAEKYSGISPDQRLTSGERCGDHPYRASFAILWDELNDQRATWKSNPWVWRIEFRRLDV